MVNKAIAKTCKWIPLWMPTKNYGHPAFLHIKGYECRGPTKCGYWIFEQLTVTTTTYILWEDCKTDGPSCKEFGIPGPIPECYEDGTKTKGSTSSELGG